MKWKKVLIISAGLLILILMVVIVIDSIYFSPQTAFKRTLGFELPNSVIIKNYEHHEHLFDENELYFKISLSESDYKTMKSNLLKYSDETGLREMQPNDIIPYFQNTCNWWDMDKDDILVGYQAFQDGKLAKTKLSNVFFTKDKENKYFMYVAD